MRNIFVKLSVIAAIPVVAIGYTNCSKVSFQNYELSSEAKLAALNAGGILINDGASFTNSTDVTLRLEHNSATQMYITDTPECTNGGEWEAYSQTKLWKLQANNDSGSVFVKYREEKTPEFESGCFTDEIVHDNIAPEVIFKRAAGDFFNKENFSFEFEITDSLSGVGGVGCVSNPEWTTACNSAVKVHQMKEGSQNIAIIARDKAGNVANVKQDSFVIDLTVPRISWVKTPAAVTSSTLGEFAFIGQDALSGVDKYECRPSASAAWKACTSPSNGSFAEGQNSFSVRVYDRSGNVSAALPFNWTIDNTAPSVTITSNPLPLANINKATFTFIGMDDGLPINKFECRLGTGSFASCVSGQTYSNLGQGEYSFEVRGFDTANNPSAPVGYNFSVDLTKPTVVIKTKPNARTASASAAFTFEAKDNKSVKDVMCSIDGAESKCSTIASQNYPTLADGSHTFKVHAIDAAGNVGDSATWTWVIDRQKPVVEIIAGPVGQVKNVNAAFTFTAVDAGGGSIFLIECKLEGNWEPCTTPKSYMELAEGSYLFQVRATDDVGNISDIKSRQFMIDSLAPAINYGQVPAKTIFSGTNSQIQYTVTDSGVGTSTVLCGFDKTNLAPCPVSAQRDYPNLAVGSYTFTVRAEDKLGNSSESSVTWVVQQKTKVIGQNVLVTSNNKADILIVIDNSGSMNSEQKSMAARFGSLLDKLSGLDWQVAIVTTDVRTDATNKALKDGRLLSFASGRQILKSTDDLAEAKAIFATTIQRKASEGSGYEQGIAATFRSIQRSNTGIAEDATNQAFFRSDAVLSVIVVTDADETPEKSALAFNNPQNLINLVKERWSQKSFVFHSIIVPIGDGVCLSKDGNEGYGYTYDSLSRTTGGIVGTVCSTDYAGQLSTIGQATVDQIRAANLDCVPLDTNGDGKGDVSVQTSNGSAAPGYVIDGLKITFNSSLPAGNNKLNYTCVAN